MRRWQDLAAPDDPGSWYAVSNMWPTKRGTYETADTSSATSVTGSSADAVLYAFTARNIAGTVLEYVQQASKIWQYSGGTLTDRTGGVSVTSAGMMAQYGNVTIFAQSASVVTTFATGGNFAALAGAPNAEIVVVQSNAVLLFNTSASADGWAASDVGDYTNWTTGEAASGRILEVPGPIMGAVSYGADVLVFKKSAIFRMTYVGGTVKWQIQLVWKGLGLGGEATYTKAKYQLVATAHGVAFNCNQTLNLTTVANTVYLFDGSSTPVQLDPLTNLDDCHAVFLYDPIEDRLVLAPSLGSSASGVINTATSTTIPSVYYYYSFASGAWGSGVGNDSENFENGTNFTLLNLGNGVLQGDYYSRSEASSKPVFWRYKTVTTGAFFRNAPLAPASGASCYLQTAMLGRPDAKTFWDRLTPLLRRRTDLGTDTATLSIELYRERHDTSPVTTISASEATDRKRFNFTANDNFARFKVTWAAIDAEVDDFLIRQKTASQE